MDLRKLKTLIDLVAESGISELEVTEGEGKVRIVKSDPAAAIAVQQRSARRDTPCGLVTPPRGLLEDGIAGQVRMRVVDRSCALAQARNRGA